MNLKNLIVIYFLFACVLFSLTECGSGDEKNEDKEKENNTSRGKKIKIPDGTCEERSTGTNEINIDDQELQHFINIHQKKEMNIDPKLLREMICITQQFKQGNMSSQNFQQAKLLFYKKLKEYEKGKNVDDQPLQKQQRRQETSGIAFRQPSIATRGIENVLGKGKASIETPTAKSQHKISDYSAPQYVQPLLNYSTDLSHRHLQQYQKMHQQLINQMLQQYQETGQRMEAQQNQRMPYHQMPQQPGMQQNRPIGKPYFDQQMPQQRRMQNIPPTQVQGTRANPQEISDDDEDTESDEN